jgi:hypothetical protein
MKKELAESWRVSDMFLKMKNQRETGRERSILLAPLGTVKPSVDACKPRYRAAPAKNSARNVRW